MSMASSMMPVDILRLADLAVDEDDRQLLDAEAELVGAVGQLDLEAVAAGADGVEVERLQHAAAEALVAAGQVAVGQAQDGARIEAAAAADDLAQRAPVLDAAALHVARAEHHVGALLDEAEEVGQVGGVVREVGVHLEDEVGAVVEGLAEAGHVRLAQALLAGAMQHLDVGVLGRQPSASWPVPSGESSSTMSVCSWIPWPSATSRMRSRAWARFSRSLYVGSTMVFMVGKYIVRRAGPPRRPVAG